MDDVSRQVASLALANFKQEGHLSVRQYEQLRRAFATAGDSLEWIASSLDGKNPDDAARKDVLTLAKRGVKAMEKDLEAELATKRKEIKVLGAVAVSARKLSEDPKTAYPTDIIYEFTARDATQTLVTKTHTVTPEGLLDRPKAGRRDHAVPADAEGALKAAESIEKSLVSREKLTDLMIHQLEDRHAELDVLRRALPDFVKFSHALLREVITNLQ